MEPDRSSYPTEQEPPWFSGEQFAEPGWDDRHEPRIRYAESGRAPGSGPPAGAGPAGQQHSLGGPVGPRSGEPLPPPDLPGPEPLVARDQIGSRPPHDPTATRQTPVVEPRYHAEAIDRAALRRGPVATPPVSDGIYRARRPAVAVLLGALAAALAVPVSLLLAASVDPPVSVTGVITGVLALSALPLAALGMYGLATGAARVPDAPPTHAWLRPPLAYLAVALVLFLAAGLAAS